MAKEALQHLDHLFRVAFHLAREPQEAHDLVQETYLRAINSYGQFSPGTNMKAWLTRILYNHFLDGYHEKKRWAVLGGRHSDEQGSDYLEKVAEEGPDPQGHYLVRELRFKISEALRKIPEEFRTAVVLVDMEEFSYAEAAAVLSCPVGTVRSRLFRGRRHLYQELKEYVGVDAEGRRKREK